MRVDSKTLETIRLKLYQEIPEAQHSSIAEYELAVKKGQYIVALNAALRLTVALSWQPSAKLVIMLDELRRQILDNETGEVLGWR